MCCVQCKNLTSCHPLKPLVDVNIVFTFLTAWLNIWHVSLIICFVSIHYFWHLQRSNLCSFTTPSIKLYSSDAETRQFKWNSLGQRALQVIFCTDMPSQKAPPFRGAGLVQVRERFWTPLPHSTLQGDHSVHRDQPPFTEVSSAKLEKNKR